MRFYLNETVFNSDHLILSVTSFCFLKEENLCLGTSYKTKDVFIRPSYYYYCEKPAWDVESDTFARESVWLCPFCGLYVREFEFSHSNPVNRIRKLTRAHNLHVKMLDFRPFTIRT